MDRVKYINAILYFAKNTPNLGKVKLNKLLYYLDFDHFEKHGEAITNDVYVNMDLGPVPMHIDDVLNEMVTSGLITIDNEQVIDYTRFKITALRPFNPNAFKPNEVAMLCEINEKWGHLTAQELVIASHGEAPWLATRKGEEIPYPLAYYRGKYEQPADEESIKVSA